MAKKKNRAFLKWAGGKYSLVDQIKSKLPEADQLIEPFVGAASVFLNTDYDNYVLNDINPDLIALYQHLKNDPAELIKEAQKLFIPQNNQENHYYGLREEFNGSADSFERSALFVYLNRHGYNGLCRYNSKGRFNVPFGRYKRPYFPEAEMTVFAEKAQTATFTCSNFETLFDDVKPNSVFYCDPPYVPLSATASFTSYAKSSFEFSSQMQLARLARQTAKSDKVHVLVSNHDLPLTRQLYDGASITSIEVKRSISQNGKNRKPVKELLALFSP